MGIRMAMPYPPVLSGLQCELLAFNQRFAAGLRGHSPTFLQAFRPAPEEVQCSSVPIRKSL
jgi:hypothetical protein